MVGGGVQVFLRVRLVLRARTICHIDKSLLSLVQVLSIELLARRCC